ncbi:MAG: tetratricopeptide repeat protein [Cyanobacteria bacterium P01_A01_bin.105]
MTGSALPWWLPVSDSRAMGLAGTMGSLMAGVSVCMIVKDEAARLPACLASLAELEAEIIVCDTGSSDDTAAIAAQFGAQVHHIEWTDDFAAARNQSLQRATRDWILVIDADEVLTETGRQHMQALLTNPSLWQTPTEDLLLVTWLRQEMGARQSPYTQVTRLFRNHPQLRFSRPYHESIDDSADALMQATPHWQAVQWDQVAFTHSGYSDGAIAAQDKFQRAERIMARHLVAHPQDGYICNKLGALYGAQGDWAKGLTYLERGSAQATDPMTRYELHYHAGLAHRSLNRPTQAQKYYQAALAVPIADRLKLSAHLNLGSLYKHQGQLTDAQAQFEAAIQVDHTLALAHYNLGVVYRAQGSLEPALDAYQQAIALEPTYAEAHQNLAAIFFKLGRLPESRAAFQTAVNLYKKTNPAAAIRLQQGAHQLGLGGLN